MSGGSMDYLSYKIKVFFCMKKIYAVNSGCYSDYRIDALFSSKKKADDFMESVKDNDYNDIEVYELDPPTSDLVKRGYAIWKIIMLKDGSVESIYRIEINKYSVSMSGSHFIWKRSEAPAYIGKGILDALDSSVWAKTEKQAIKIVNEKRAQMIATGEFV